MLQSLGVCLRDAKRYEEAGFGNKKVKLGENDLQVAYTLQSLGVCLRDAKR